MVDYSRFEGIDTDSDEETRSFPYPSNSTSPSSSIPHPNTQKPTKMTQKGKEGRLKFEYEGRTIYEWEQSLEEVNIYVAPPPHNTRHDLHIVITHRHLIVGLKGAPPFIDEDTWGPVKPDESMWTFVDGEININLQKMNKAEAWHGALKGRGKPEDEIDAFTKEEVKKKLMLERFQEEHPGFDFSGAEFNGTVPDAREFMGGISHG